MGQRKRLVQKAAGRRISRQVSLSQFAKLMKNSAYISSYPIKATLILQWLRVRPIVVVVVVVAIIGGAGM